MSRRAGRAVIAACWGAALYVALLCPLTSPIGPERFTVPDDTRQLQPGQLDPNGPGAGALGL